MRTQKGFTLIEMIIVIIIVGILATVLVPLLQGHVEDAKWAEGEAGMGTIATALRAYIVEFAAAPVNGTMAEIGLLPNDLLGKYFVNTNYSYAVTTVNPMDYLITATAPAGWTVGTKTLDETGTLIP